MTNIEKIKEIVLQLKGESIDQDIDFNEDSAFVGALIMAEWKEKQEKQVLDKVCDWLSKNFYCEETMVDCIAYKHKVHDVNDMIGQFRKAMDE